MGAGTDTPQQDRQDRQESKRSEGTVRKGQGTEAARKGGNDAASRQAHQDWQDSAKESGD